MNSFLIKEKERNLKNEKQNRKELEEEEREKML